jgi:hypothetical protein
MNISVKTNFVGALAEIQGIIIFHLIGRNPGYIQ